MKFVYPQLKRQYRSEKYPFSCDFHDPVSDIYFEFNGTWTHGGHFFDENSDEDRKRLEIWKKKAETSKFYENAVQTWTVRDVEKLRAARRGELRYVVFWNISEVLEFVLDFDRA